jgi:hypothetical protein
MKSSPSLVGIFLVVLGVAGAVTPFERLAALTKESRELDASGMVSILMHKRSGNQDIPDWAPIDKVRQPHQNSHTVVPGLVYRFS